MLEVRQRAQGERSCRAREVILDICMRIVLQDVPTTNPPALVHDLPGDYIFPSGHGLNFKDAQPSSQASEGLAHTLFYHSLNRFQSKG